MFGQLRIAAVMLAVLTVITGVCYPLLVTGLAQAFFPHEANGSLVRAGSAEPHPALIGQPFAAPGYFWSRPSATTPHPYNAAASSGSNLGPTNPALMERIRDAAERLRAGAVDTTAGIPVDLLTASASGLDPHCSPAAMRYQIPRVARERGIAPDRLEALIAQHTEGRLLGIFGEPRINVVRLNHALNGLVASREGLP